MKKRILPYGFVTLLIAGFTAFFFISATENEVTGTGNDAIGGNSIIKAKEYLAQIRNNQITGVLDPRDELKVREQIKERAALKSSAGNDLDWIEMGPDNIGGRTRAVIFDNRDPNSNTIYASGVTGGIFKTVNFGATWHKVNISAGNLYVSCMIQSANGTIYVGTGEGFNSNNYTALGEMGYNGGFIGTGIYKSDSDDNFSLVPGTEPQTINDTIDWAYVNEIALGSDGRLWAATNTGLKVKTGNGWITASYTDTTGAVIELTGQAFDVKVSETTVIVAVDGKGYVSPGSPDGFEGISYGLEGQLPAEGVGRIEFAIAPSNNDVIYALAASASDKSLKNIYISEDAGESWEVIGPGGSEYLNVLGSTVTYVDANNSTMEETYYQGDFDNTIVVFPNNPYKILAGGIDMWVGYRASGSGYFHWTKKSQGTEIDIFSDLYVHSDHHAYAFRPDNPNQVAIGCDGGVFLCNISGDVFAFQNMNKQYNVTQFYSIGITGQTNVVAGGTQDNGSILIDGNTSTPNRGIALWNMGDFAMPDGGDGGYAAISNIWSKKTGVGVTPPVIFYSKAPLPNNALKAQFRRSETMGFDFASKYLTGDISSENFLTPVVLWECYNNENSRDSVNFIAFQDYEANDQVVIRSSNSKCPFDYTLPDAMNQGDTIRVKDIISTKLFIAATDKIWMTVQGLQFNVDPKWFLISDVDHYGVAGDPQCLAYSADANYAWVGTQQGKLYRISNIAYAYNYDMADVRSSSCIIATDTIAFNGDNTQVITSISVDPLDANKVMVTLGNYGNDNYVFYTENALSDSPDFTSVQGDLPQMPIYSSVLEMHSDDVAVIGTEKGIWVSDNVASGEWYQASNEMNDVPVFALKQQYLFKKTFTITTIDPASGQESWEIYPGIENTGMIYAATYGRGIFRCETFGEVGYDDHSIESKTLSQISIYPNPAVTYATVAFDLDRNSNVELSVYDIQGRVVKSVSRNNLQSGHQTISIDVKDLNKGTYIVRFVAGSKTATSKFVIIK
jgi:hypothetical protein